MNWYQKNMVYKSGGIVDTIADWTIKASIGALIPLLGYVGYDAVQNLKNSPDTPQVIEQIISDAESAGAPAQLIQNVKQDIQKQINTEYEFPYNEFREKLKQYEGFKNKVYLDGRGIKTIGIGHQLTNESPVIFENLFGNKVDFNNILYGRDTLSNEEVNLLADYDIAKHIERARAIFPKFSTYPPNIQMALLNGVYRGEFSPQHKTVKLINSGDFGQAANEYINRQDYRNPTGHGGRGVKRRMDENRKEFLEYARNLGQI